MSLGKDRPPREMGPPKRPPATLLPAGAGCRSAGSRRWGWATLHPRCPTVQAGARCPVPQGHTYIPPMETVAHVRSEKAGMVSVALLAGRM